jgi:hypothetical protein
MEGYELVLVEEAVDSLLASLFRTSNNANRFPEDVGRLGFLALAINAENKILFRIYPSFKDTITALDEILTSDLGGPMRFYRSNLHRPKLGTESCVLRTIEGVKNETLIRLVQFRLSQLIQVTSRGYYKLIPGDSSPEPQEFHGGCWFRAAITYREPE